MKKSILLTLVAIVLSVSIPLSAEAICSCDASTKYKCKSEDSAGNKCSGTGVAKAEVQFR